MKKMIYVGMPVLNCVKYTKDCLKSIRSDKYDLYVNVIDNASTDGTKDYLEEQMKTASDLHESIKHLHVITNAEPNCCAGSWNQIIENSMVKLDGEYCLVSNNDIIFHPKTIDNLVNFLESSEENIVLTSALNVRGALENPWDILNYEPDMESSYSEHPDFACYMINKKCLDIVGLFNEQFKPGFFEDNNYHDRILFRGLKAVSTPSAPYYHHGSTTQNQIEGGICTGELFEKNRAIYNEIKMHLEEIHGGKLT